MSLPRDRTLGAVSSFSSVLVNRWTREVGASKTALLSPKGESASYGNLVEVLESAAVHPRVTAIVFSPSVRAIVAYLKSLSEPGPTILLDHKISPKNLAEIAGRFDVEYIEGPPSVLSAAGFTIRSEADDWSNARRQKSFPNEAISDSISTVLIGTSGSTGNRKFVRLSSSAVLTNAVDIKEGLGISMDDVGATVLPPSYSYGLSVVNSILLAGGTILASELNPLQRQFREQMRANRVTHLPGVPSLYAIYERMGLISDPPGYVTSFTQAGGKLSPAKVRDYALALRARKVKFFPMYGQTEATARMSILDSSLAAEHPDSVGEAVRSGSFSVGSADNDEEILFSGPNVMLGYAEKNLGAFDRDDTNGILATGDLGHLSGGLLYIHGRAKRIVKISGVRVDLDELESMVEPFGECAIVSDDNQLFVFIVSAKEATVTRVEERLIELGQMRRNFRIVEIPSMFFNSSGKKDYPKLTSLIAG